mgnify:CR=1 FL=1
MYSHRKLGIIKEKDTTFQKEDDEMIVKPVNAGEKTMDEIKEMIKNIDDETMISIDFTSLGMDAEEGSHE